MLPAQCFETATCVCVSYQNQAYDWCVVVVCIRIAEDRQQPGGDRGCAA